MLKRKRLLLVIVVAILLVILIPTYRATILKSRENVLKVNLASMRDVIKRYTKDKQEAPRTLQDLVDAGYYRELPVDPITDSNGTWTPVFETVIISPGKTARGITDLHSGSTSSSLEGTLYQTW